MSDIALIWDNGTADFAITANDLETDEGLETAVAISLFTDRRAEDGDVLPDGGTDLHGWWGDQFADVDDDRIGSRLWLLARSKATDDVATRAKDYVREALAWLVVDQISDSVDVESEIVDSGVLALAVSISRPKGRIVQFRYQYNWAAQEAKAVA